MRTGSASWSPGAQPLGPDDPPTVGAYRLLGKLGEGGMGAVYLGLSGTGRKVAVKVIRRELASGPTFRARFSTEVANAQRVASFCTAAAVGIRARLLNAAIHIEYNAADDPTAPGGRSTHPPLDRLTSDARRAGLTVIAALTACNACRA